MKTKFYDIHHECTDKEGKKHVVTVVGKFTQCYEREHVEKDVEVDLHEKSRVTGKLTYKRKVMTRALTVGISICHPDDKFDKDVGIRIAKRRIREGYDAGTVYTHDATMLTPDQIMAQLLVKLSYVCNNIDEYLP